jgi:hypothetical protein
MNSVLSNPAAFVADRARRLAAEGRYRDAIELLSREPLDTIDLQTLCDLVGWRLAAFDPQRGAQPWPATYRDPFPGAGGPPEIGRSALTTEILGGAIQHHGCLLVRGLISGEETRSLAGVVERAFAAAAAFEAERMSGGAPERSPWFAPYPLAPDDGMKEPSRYWLIENGGVWTADSPRALTDFIRFLRGHGVLKVIEDYLGERTYLSLGKSTLRRVPPTALGGWHQDGAFLGLSTRTVNCWLTLSDCGEDAPGLDVYPRRLNGLVETGTRGAPFTWAVGDAVVDDMAKSVPHVMPRFAAGDALLFDQLLLHRTGVRPGMTRERLAIESWFFAGSTFPMEQMPIAL